MSIYVCVYTDMYVCVHVVSRYTIFTYVCRYVSVDVYRYIWLTSMRQVFKIFMYVCVLTEVGQICRQN